MTFQRANLRGYVKALTNSIKTPFISDLIDTELEARCVEIAGCGDVHVFLEIVCVIMLGGPGLLLLRFVQPVIGAP